MTTIREFFTKLIQADNSAQTMMDANLKSSHAFTVKVIENGKEITKLAQAGTAGAVQLTAKGISELAQQDATQAVNLMSDLVTKNLLKTETLIKVFNGRYGLIVSSMLREVGGDVDAYNKKINEATKLGDDYLKQMNNLNNAWDLFKNRLVGANSGIVLTTKNVLNLVASIGNGILGLDGFAGKLINVTSSSLTMAISVTAIAVAVSNVAKMFKGATMAVELFGFSMKALPFAGIAIAIGIGISVLSEYIMKNKQAKLELLGMQATSKKLTVENQMLNDSIKAMKSTLNSFSSVNARAELGNIALALGSITDSAAEAKQALLDLQGIEAERKGLDAKQTKKNLDNTRKEIKIRNDMMVENQKKLNYIEENSFSLYFSKGYATVQKEKNKLIASNVKLNKEIDELRNKEMKESAEYNKQSVDLAQRKDLAIRKITEEATKMSFGATKQLL